MNTALRILLMGGMDPDAREWASRVAANGGAVSGVTLRAVSRFIRDCKASGIWTKLTRLNLICGDFVAARVPLVAGGGSATETLTNIVSGDYAETGTSAGIKGNATDKSFSVGWNPTALSASASSFGQWVYVRGTASGGSKVVMGAANGTSNTYLGWVNSGTVEAGGIGQAMAGEIVPSSTAGPTTATKEGLLGVATNGSRDQQYYHNGSAIGSAVAGTGALPNQSILGLAFANSAGAASAFSDRYLRAYAITTGMSAADAAAFNAAMQRFQTALGRNV